MATDPSVRSSLTCQRQCLIQPHLITPLTTIALVIARRRQFDSQVDFVWLIGTALRRES